MFDQTREYDEKHVLVVENIPCLFGLIDLYKGAGIAYIIVTGNKYQSSM